MAQGEPPAQSVGTGTLESLYPFLYADPDAGAAGLDAVMAQVRQSTAQKVRDIVELRDSVLRADRGRLELCASAMAAAFDAGGRLLAFGNGGSSTDAQDIASLFLSPPGARRPLPAFSLTNDIAVVTALANDIGFDSAFARQIGALGRPGDIALGLSTSGNSANLLLAFEEAASRGMVTVGIAGYDGGKMAELDLLDHLFVVPSPSVHRIQEAQTSIYHALWELASARLPMDSGGPFDEEEVT